jgi:hypothetical protein
MARTTADAGGHNPLVLMGMIDPAVELYLVKGPAGNVVTDTKRGEDDKCIKPRGKILTMTAGEAVEYGWAKGICSSPAGIRRMLQVPEWTSGGDAGWEQMRAHAVPGRLAHMQEEAQKGLHDAAVRQAFDDAKVNVRQLREDMGKCDTEIEQCKEQLEKLGTEHEQERARIGNTMAWAGVDRAYANQIKQTEARLDYWQQRQTRTKQLLELARKSGMLDSE